MDLSNADDQGLFDFAVAARRATPPDPNSPPPMLLDDDAVAFALGMLAAELRSPAPVRVRPGAAYSVDDAQKLVDRFAAELCPLIGVT